MSGQNLSVMDLKSNEDNEDILTNVDDVEDKDEFKIVHLKGDIKSFFSGSTVFLTGATGFLGKALIEKLLRSCEDVKTIYILMRPKNGLSVEMRFKDYLKNEVFGKIKDKWPERLDKLKPIKGDVALPNLGMLPPDLVKLSEEINIVIHSAATVRFVEPLSEALKLNTLGTKRVIDLCHTMKNLKSMVHVSTAYSNASLQDIEEKIYPTRYDPDALFQCANILPPETINLIGPQLSEEHPNTYTFTKSLAEQIVKKYGAGLPVCIFRPSIITGALKEPFPGWVDNVFGVTGITMQMYKGTIRTAMGINNYNMDIVPVDFTVNACLAAAWHHTHYKSLEPKVYNCTSGPINSLTWHNFYKYVIIHARKHPSKHTTFYPNFKFTTSTTVNMFWEGICHYTPAILYDISLKLKGKKPFMMKLCRYFKNATLSGQYFAAHHWNFGFSRMGALLKDVERTGQDNEFYCNFSQLDWYDYINRYVIGIRTYLLKDSLSSMPEAKRKIQRLYWIQRLLQVISFYCLFKIVFVRLLNSSHCRYIWTFIQNLILLF